MGSVFTWHMYRPASSGWTLRMCKCQVRWWSNETLNRPIRVTTFRWIVKIIALSKCTHATCSIKHKLQLLIKGLNYSKLTR